ncbi:MAG TPA: RDD family protein [Crocinitomicaceae bacterium]|nr:RDD family protein [Crocinitomicaceae bacterium]
MEKLLINTPQNVDIEYSLASVGSRILAIALDFAIIIGYIFIVYRYVLSYFLRNIFDTWMYNGLLMLFLLPVMFYHFLLETFMHGQTLGMKVVKLKVVKTDGSRAGVYEYFIRWVMNLVDVWLLSGFIGMAFIVFTKKSQRIGDLAAGTTVISVKPKLKLIETIFQDLKSNYQITYQSVIRLSDKDINIVKNSFNKAKAKKNAVVISALAEKLQKVLELDKINSSEEKFIETVLKDHYHLFREKK